MAIKVAASLALTIFLALSFGWDKPYWGAVTVIVMATTESYGHAIQKVSHRLFGTVIGAVVGFTLISCFGQQRELFFLSVLSLGAISSYMSARSANGYVYKMAFIVAIIVSLAGGLSEGYSFQLAVIRIQETLLGAVCFSLVFSLLWPESNAARVSRKQLAVQSKEAIASKREGVFRAIKFIFITIVSWALWIYLSIPDGFMFPLLAATLGVSMVEFSSKLMNKMLGLIYLWSAIILLEYVFILPMLETGWQLAAFYFINCFVIWRLFYRPEHLVVRMLGGQFLVLMTMTAQYLTPVYDINSPLQMLLFLSLVLITVKMVSQLVEELLQHRLCNSD
ncbi:FUSC family protein [Agarivorans sp. 1_MG-2023]|uniref:FUSC family protein n=1 Tax=Agarivorans sp. 1_MG-2023 TaxID=3062634 RepID=UPI0026E2CBFE|nr:FUSC family protein [Agarivorans sp. 1_MG-2023]MDO6762146.1 FUSC family protein [Agarivorans sp. 1_MG-2023]